MPSLLSVILLPIWLLLSALTVTSGIVGVAWTRTAVSMLFILALLAYQQADTCALKFPQSATTSVSSLYLTKIWPFNTLDRGEYEWCSDSGTNRFVTNDSSDFVPSTIKYVDTKVAVGGGHVVSNMTGTVTIRSLDHKHLLHCENVLFIPQLVW